MHHVHGFLLIFFGDETGNGNFRGADNIQIDVFAGQSAKHTGRYTGISQHTCANDGNLGYVGFYVYPGKTDLVL